MEADQVRHLTNVWVKAFQEYAAGVHDRCEPLMAETQRLLKGSEERRAKAMEVYKLYSAKIERQWDLYRRVKKLAKLRGDWPERPENELQMKPRESFVFIHSALAAFSVAVLGLAGPTIWPDIDHAEADRAATFAESFARGWLLNSSRLASLGLLLNASAVFLAHNGRFVGAHLLSTPLWSTLRLRTNWHRFERFVSLALRASAVASPLVAFLFYVAAFDPLWALCLVLAGALTGLTFLVLDLRWRLRRVFRRWRRGYRAWMARTDAATAKLKASTENLERINRESREARVKREAEQASRRDANSVQATNQAHEGQNDA